MESHHHHQVYREPHAVREPGTPADVQEMHPISTAIFEEMAHNMDLKTHNIVVHMKQSTVKIVDFGLSNYWCMEEPLSTHCGSPEYAAPELYISGRKYGPEVDLWSLGVIIFYMSAGVLPFRLEGRELSLSYDQQRRLLVSRIRKGVLQKHKNFISHYSKEFSNLISGLLNTSPKERFSVLDVLSHSWTSKSRNPLADVSEPLRQKNDIHYKVMRILSQTVDMKSKELEYKVIHEPLGPLGGMHRILYHKELRRIWRSYEAFSSLHPLSGPLSSGNLVMNTRKRNKMEKAAAKDLEKTCVKIMGGIWIRNQDHTSSPAFDDPFSLYVKSFAIRSGPYNYKKSSQNAVDRRKTFECCEVETRGSKPCVESTARSAGKTTTTETTYVTARTDATSAPFGLSMNMSNAD